MREGGGGVCVGLGGILGHHPNGCWQVQWGPPQALSAPPPGLYKHFPWAIGRHTAILGCGILSLSQGQVGTPFSPVGLQTAQGEGRVAPRC